jgi:hypothetical protein
MPKHTKKNHSTKRKHNTRKHNTRKLSSNNSGYNANSSNSSNSNVNAHSTNSIEGIANRNNRGYMGVNNLMKYSSNNAHIIANISSKHKSYSGALGELLEYIRNHKLTPVHKEILHFRLKTIYNV